MNLKPFVYYWDLFVFYIIIIQLNFCPRSSCKHVLEMYTPLHPIPPLYCKTWFTGVYIFSYFVLKRRLRVLVEAVLTDTLADLSLC